MDTSRTPADTVRMYLDRFGQADTEGALSLLAEGVVWHVDGAPEVPTIGLRQGKGRIKEWIEVFPDTFEPRGFHLHSLSEDGPEIWVKGWFRYLVRSTRRTVEGDFAMHFTVREGLIRHYQIFEDSLALARAFRAEAPASGAAVSTDRVRVNDTVYAFDDTGEGPVVLFLHGLFLDRTVFAAQTRALAEGHRCIALDMPGHGSTTWPARGWTLDDIASDIALLIREKGWGPVTLVGQSQGGMVAARTASRHPELVDGVVLMGTSARTEPSDRIPDWQRRRAQLVQSQGAAVATVAEEIQRLATDPSWRATHPGEARVERELMAAQDPEAMQLAIEAAVLGRSDIRDMLPAIQAPTLVIGGENDEAMPPRLSAELAELIPDARLEILSGVAHHAPLEAPEQVNRLLASFLQGELVRAI